MEIQLSHQQCHTQHKLHIPYLVTQIFYSFTVFIKLKKNTKLSSLETSYIYTASSYHWESDFQSKNSNISFSSSIHTLSVLPEAMRLLLWLTAISDTSPEWPLRVPRSLPSSDDHIFNRQSSAPLLFVRNMYSKLYILQLQ